MAWLDRPLELLRLRWIESGHAQHWRLIPMAAVLGVAMGVGAVAFDFLVEGSGHFFFGVLGKSEFPGAGLLLLVLLPATGGLLVGLIGLLSGRLTPGHRGHGIPIVVEGLMRKDGRIPGRVGVFRAVTSSLTIGSGGSAGVEGPILVIGASLSSWLARLARVNRDHRRTLVAAGAAAAMAAIFNAPIAGVIFVLEVVLRDFTPRTFIPIVIASVFGTATARALLGHDQALFGVVDALVGDNSFTVWELGHYAALGVLCGLLGAGFNVGLRRSEGLGRRLPGPNWLKPATGGAILGLLGIAFVLLFRQPVVGGHAPPTFFGNGYPVVEALLRPASYLAAPGPHAAGTMLDAGPVLLAALLAFKFAGTCVTIGSGGAGGVIAPSLLMGATLGAGFAAACGAAGVFPGETPATYALVGMAGVIAAVVHCPLTAFLLVFEMTGDYQLILPVMLVAILATVVAQLLVSDSIYTAMLRDRGIRTGVYADYTLLRRLHAHDVQLLPAVAVHPDDPAQRLIDLSAAHGISDFIVTDDTGRYLGMVVAQDLRDALLQRDAVPLLNVHEMMRTRLPRIDPEESLDSVIERFSRHDASTLPVIDNTGSVRGLLSRVMLMKTYQQLLDARG